MKGSVSDDEIKALQAKGADAIEKLEKGTGEGSDFLGWLHLPSSISENSVADIEKTAAFVWFFLLFFVLLFICVFYV